MKSLQNKNILFIGIGFYDYDHLIYSKLVSMGAKVTYVCENNYSLTFELIKRTSFSDKSLKNVRTKKLSLTLSSINENDLDYVFVIKGEFLNKILLESLKAKHAKAIFILYQWDSCARLKNCAEIFPFFDRIYTFDRDDHLHKGLIFRPLFFREESAPVSNYRYDLSFVGWLHFDRLSLVNDLMNALEEGNLRTYFFLKTNVFNYLKLIIKGNAKGVGCNAMSYADYVHILHQSKAVLDFQHPLQSGLTMRCLESVGANKKIVTSNADIRNYDFFNENNVFVLEEGFTTAKLISFIESDFVPIDENIKSRYTLSSWIADIFER